MIFGIICYKICQIGANICHLKTFIPLLKMYLIQRNLTFSLGIFGVRRSATKAALSHSFSNIVQMLLEENAMNNCELI